MHFPCGETLPPAFDPVLFYNFIFLNSLGFFFVVVVVRFPLASYFFFLSFCCCCEAKEPIGGEGVRARWIVRPFSCSIAMYARQELEDGRAKKGRRRKSFCQLWKMTLAEKKTEGPEEDEVDDDEKKMWSKKMTKKRDSRIHVKRLREKK